VPLTVLVFASYAEVLGGREVTVPVDAPCVAHAIVAALRALPGGDRLPASPLVAVNHAWVDGAHLVQPGDEVAVIPPVAGG
jgi:molybdopterin synthase sulfur carrier subunit